MLCRDMVMWNEILARRAALCSLQMTVTMVAIAFLIQIQIQPVPAQAPQGQPQSRRQPQSTAPADLSFLSTNARSLLPKIEELSLLVAKVKPSLIFVTETWLNDSVPDSALSLPGYSSLVRRDRVGRRGGGALVFVQDGLHFSRRPDLEHWDEDIWIELTPSGMGNRWLLFGCFHSPPNSDIDKFCSALESSFSHLDLQRADVFLLGDFNATSPSWLSSDDYNSAGTVLEPLFLQLSLQQLLSSATRFQPSQSSGREPRDSLLHLVLTSNAALVSSTSVLPPIGSSDHAVVRCALELSTRSSPAQSGLTRIWAYEKADLRELNNVFGFF